jgi:hypothetical protein
MLVMYQRRSRYVPASGAARRPERQAAQAVEAESQVYSGKLVGPAGPLAGWPFLLKRDGVPADQRSLHGTTSNTFRDGAWISAADGSFRFENLPEAGYSVEALLPGQNIILNTEPLPEGLGETGEREAMPTFGPTHFDGDKEDWFRPTRSAEYDNLLDDVSE